MSEFENVYTVSEVTRRVKERIESDPELADVRVEGEVSNFTHHTSGHMYFDLKDDDAVVSCVMFEGDNSLLDFEPEDGDDVIAEGRVSVYEKRGDYQLYVGSMTKVGEGELHRRFLELRSRLADEGLFDDELKKTLPRFPRRVGVVTSDSGAALHDIRDVVERRFPVEVRLAPAKVQGDDAAPDIAGSLRRLDGDCDVVIVGRGGGSIEDLWAFNEEVVARAVHDCETPVISAVGHEVDTTITDLVADERAATPSEAAEIAVPEMDETRARLDELAERVRSAAERTVETRRERVEGYARFFRRRPPVVEEYAQRLDELETSLEREVERRIEERENAVREKASVLDSLSPLKVLSRGYSVTESDGEVVSSVDDVESGDPLDVRVSDGTVSGRVEDVECDDGDDEHIH